MRTFSIISLGCKVNQYESQQIRQLLQEYGLEQIKIDQNPDLALVHTCCVTHTAASKSRQAIRKALKKNPHCKVIATGCLTTTQTGETDNLPDGIIQVSRDQDLPDILRRAINEHIEADTLNPKKTQSANIISKTAIDHKIKYKNELNCSEDPLKLKPLADYTDQSRAFLKIQDGCDGFCTYCIIPKTRSRIWSNPPEKVIAEAKQLVETGHNEIVLTGIFLGAYGQSTVKHKRWDPSKQNQFVEMVDKIAQIPGLKRLRLSSLEPGDVTEDLLNIFCRHENIAPHLHLPLQAGSSRILRRMNRQYNADEFREMIEMVNEKLDRPAITTDIIVGFPGETDEDFEETMKMSRYAKFAKIHAFSYSLRKGTAAERMDGHLPPEIVKHRATELGKLDKELQGEFSKQFAGEKISVIVENAQKQMGRCGRYFEVKLVGSNIKRGQFTYARLRDNCYEADLIEE